MSQAEWEAHKRYLWERAGGKCERCHSTQGPFDPEHAKESGDGGADSRDNNWLTCRRCHELKRAPYTEGRLLVEPLGNEAFAFTLVQGSKHNYTVLERVIYRATSHGGEWERTA